MNTAALRSSEPPWWANHGNLALLYRYLVETDKLDPAQWEEVGYFLEKPWKWDLEWHELTNRVAATTPPETWR